MIKCCADGCKRRKEPMDLSFISFDCIPKEVKWGYGVCESQEKQRKKCRISFETLHFLVGVARLELAASWSRTMRATSCATPRKAHSL